MQFGFLFALFFAVLVTFFAIGNAQDIWVNFFFTEVQLPTAALILMSTAAGALITFLLGSVKYLKGFRLLGKAKKELKLSQTLIADLESQLENMKGILIDKEEDLRKMGIEKNALLQAVETKNVQPEKLIAQAPLAEKEQEEQPEEQYREQEEVSELE